MKDSATKIFQTILKNHVLPETILMVVLCTFDTLYTLFCVRAGLAEETNPVLRHTLAVSDFAFLLVKGASFLIPLTLLELIRAKRPKFVEQAMRFGFMAYAGCYFGGSVLIVLVKLYR